MQLLFSPRFIKSSFYTTKDMGFISRAVQLPCVRCHISQDLPAARRTIDESMLKSSSHLIHQVAVSVAQTVLFGKTCVGVASSGKQSQQLSRSSAGRSLNISSSFGNTPETLGFDNKRSDKYVELSVLCVRTRYA